MSQSTLFFHWTEILFGLSFYVPSTAMVMSWVSSPNHTFFLGKLDLAVKQYFKHIFSLVTDNNPSHA